MRGALKRWRVMMALGVVALALALPAPASAEEPAPTAARGPLHLPTTTRIEALVKLRDHAVAVRCSRHAAPTNARRWRCVVDLAHHSGTAWVTARVSSDRTSLRITARGVGVPAFVFVETATG